jgi:glycerate dehydrogenase
MDMDLSTLESAAQHWYWHDQIAVADMPAALADADVVVSNKVWLGDDQLAMTPKLKLVCIAAAAPRNAAVCNVRACPI